LRALSTSSRSVKSASTDIEPSFVLAIFHLPRNGQHSSYWAAACRLIHNFPLQVNVLAEFLRKSDHLLLVCCAVDDGRSFRLDRCRLYRRGIRGLGNDEMASNAQRMLM